MVATIATVAAIALVTIRDWRKQVQVVKEARRLVLLIVFFLLAHEQVLYSNVPVRARGYFVFAQSWAVGVTDTVMRRGSSQLNELTTYRPSITNCGWGSG